MKIQIAYINSDTEYLEDINASQDISVREALTQSGVLEKFPEISLELNKVGVFGEIVELGHVLSEGDRVEIYRPLSMDPMEARRLRAKQNMS